MSTKSQARLVLFLFLGLLFFAIEMGYIWDHRTDQSTVDQSYTPTTTEGLQPENPLVPIQTCLEETRCLNTSYLRLQYTNCSLITELCPEGCFNNTCLAVVCSEKYQCKNSTTRAQQNKDCSWNADEYCEFGCEDGECKEEPIAEEEPTGPLGDSNVLYAGKKKAVTVNSKEYNLSIYLIEDNQVRIQINDEESDWLTAGTNFTSYGITFTPQEIYFQRWGLQAVVYEVK